MKLSCPEQACEADIDVDDPLEFKPGVCPSCGTAYEIEHETNFDDDLTFWLVETSPPGEAKCEHTPTPWAVHDLGTEEPTVCKEHGDGHCHGIADLGVTQGVSHEQVKADAEFIVRACNAHDDLVVACEAIVHAAKLNDPAAGGVAATLAWAAIAKLE